MPRQVDHDERRAAIAEAAGRLIAERGIDGTTLRAIAAALGMANGALKHYYPGKDAVVRAALTQVFAATDARVRDRLGAATGPTGPTGLAALRIFCREVAAVGDATARVVVPLWQRALTDADLASALAGAMAGWRAQILGFLRAGRADGTITSPAADGVLAEQLLALLNGMQVLAVLPPDAPAATRRQLVDSFLDGLARPAVTGSPVAPTSDDAVPDGGPPADPGPGDGGFLAFVGTALDTTTGRLPGTDRAAMAMVLLLHRVANSLVYDLESTVHRPAGWSWSAFRLLFALWVAGPQEAGRAAVVAGMSRAAVSSLAKTLSAAGLVDRAPDARDRRGVVLSLTGAGAHRLETAFAAHNRREAEWAALLTADEVATLTTVLAKLARAAQTRDWVRHRR